MRMRLIITAFASMLALAVAAPAAAAPGDTSAAGGFGFQRSPAAQVQVQAVEGELTIQVGNSTSATFDELVLVFNRISNPASQLQSRFLFAPGEVEVFTLADCQDIAAFTIGLFINNQLVIQTGNIEPDKSLCIENLVFFEE
jgi:hypothetical protein